MVGILIVVFLILTAVLYWQFILAEGTYLGRHVVVKLYDKIAHRYDALKEYDPPAEDATLGGRLAFLLKDCPDPKVLDVATGTGRVCMTLLRQNSFRGHVCGLDRSAGMLEHARHNLAPHTSRAHLIRGDADALPFPDASFDAVSCCEALEFMPDPQRVLREMVRVVKPGGALFFTNRIGWEARFLPGKVFRRGHVAEALRHLPLERVRELPWEANYDQVWARRR